MNIRNVCFGPQGIQNKKVEQFRATNEKRSLIYILIAILFLIYMEMNFGAIFDFFLSNLLVTNAYS